jgi:type II secretory pathway pseudopilin PulG
MVRISPSDAPTAAGMNCVRRARESGVALVMALVILAILTILGISAMSTSTLQEKMAGNVQEQTKSFLAAESAMTLSADDRSTLVPIPNHEEERGPYTFSNGTQAEVVTKFLQETSGGGSSRGLGYSNRDDKTKVFHFEQTSTGVTGTIANPRAKTLIRRGIAHITIN